MNEPAGTRRCAQLVVLEGIDGAGKSTISRTLVERVRGESIVHTRYKDIARTSPDLETAMEQLVAILWPPTQHHFRQLPSDYRVLLHAAWVNLVSDGVVAPAFNAGKTLIVDGWCYKLMARFLVDGYSQDYIESIFSHATTPGHVIVLQPDPEAVWERAVRAGRQFSAVEMGLYQGHGELGRATYINYQSRTQDALVHVAKRGGAHIIIVDANLPLEQTTADVECILRDLVRDH